VSRARTPDASRPVTGFPETYPGVASPSRRQAVADAYPAGVRGAGSVVPGPEGPSRKGNQAKGIGPKYPGPEDRVKCLSIDREFSSDGRVKYRR
jgi:hypothetical protein